jgi:phenylalanyl-tRNA synthetase beta chain
MRTVLVGSLLDVARGNLARGAERVALFESGRVYLSGASVERFPGEQKPPCDEPHRIGCLAVGPSTAKSWRGVDEAADFFALKGALEALAGQLGTELGFGRGDEPFLHPGRSAHIAVGDELAGWLGEVHPLVCRAWDIDAATAFEVDLAALVAAASAGEETFEDVTTFPAVYQDLAVVVPDDVPAAEVRSAVRSGGGELLRTADVFDLYEGEQVGADRKSLALRLEFRAADRTLTDEEIAEIRVAIEKELAEIEGSLRE